MAEDPKPEETHHPSPPPHSPKKGAAMGGGRSYGSEETRRYICTVLVIFLLLAGVTALIVWLVYRPHKPHFTVVGAAIYELNTTTPNMVSTTMQFTVVVRNSNKRTGIYYDHLATYLSYRNQQITPPVMLPPLYHDTKSTVALSPIIGGGMVPVSMEVANGLVTDEAYGVVGLRLVIVGRVKYKAGSIRTAHYDMFVKCDVMMGLKKGFLGQVPLLGSPDCNVDI